MEDNLFVSRTCEIAGNELRFRASGSGGPGGQHANTSNTRVELTLSLEDSESLGPRQKLRLVSKLGPVVRVVASDQRSQFQNRQLARERLARKLAGALKTKKSRRKTRRTRSSIESRLQEKRRRSITKTRRRRPNRDD